MVVVMKMYGCRRQGTLRALPYSQSLISVTPVFERRDQNLESPVINEMNKSNNNKGSADLRDGWRTPAMFGMDVLT